MVDGEMSAEPDVYRGHEGVRRYYAGFDGLIEDLRYQPLEFEQHGVGSVTVWIRFTGRGVTSGIEVEQYAALNVHVVDGKIARMRPYLDMESAREALR